MVTLPPRPAGLPEFDHPPVDEVVLGIEFAPLRGFTQAHLGVFWNDIREDYPRTQDQIPLLDLGTLPIVIPTGIPPNAGFRTWFISNDDSSIIQVQNDRFICNWRKRGDEYPRFEPLYERFSANLALFERVAEGLELGTLSPRRIEVTYINWITDLLPSRILHSRCDARDKVGGSIGCANSTAVERGIRSRGRSRPARNIDGDVRPGNAAIANSASPKRDAASSDLQGATQRLRRNGKLGSSWKKRRRTNVH